MDRNIRGNAEGFQMLVALHPEGVDRNHAMGVQRAEAKDVALHPEGVDRNLRISSALWCASRVALHPEGVDRNIGSFLRFCNVS